MSISSTSNVETCDLCQFHYDSRVRAPMIICKSQHLCCQTCVDLYLSKEGSCCNTCKDPISNPTVFRLYPNYEVKKEEKKQKGLQELDKTKESLLPIMVGLIDIHKKGGKIQQLITLLKNLSLKCAQNEQYAQGYTLLKELIALDPIAAFDQSFIGLGCNASILAFSEEEGFDWYANRTEEKMLSLLDQLAFCFQKEGNFKKAADYYHQVRGSNAEYAKDYRIAFGAAVSEHNLGNTQAALQLYAETVSINPSFPQPFALMALIHLSRDQNELAYIRAKECLQRDGSNILALFVEAITCEPRDFETMQAKMIAIVEYQPKFICAINTLGEEYLRCGFYDKARKKFERCIAMNKVFVESWINLGKTLNLLNNESEAIKAFVEATKKVKSKVTDRECFIGIGQAYTALGHNRTALRYFLASQDEGAKQSIYLWLANIYRRLGDFKSAANMGRAFIEKASVDNQQRWDVYAKILDDFTELKQEKSVAEWGNKWANEFPSDIQVHLHAGQKLLSLQNFSEALRHFSRCMEDEFPPLQVYTPMIIANEKLGNRAKAERLRQEAKEMGELTSNDLADRFHRARDNKQSKQNISRNRRIAKEQKEE